MISLNSTMSEAIKPEIISGDLEVLVAKLQGILLDDSAPSYEEARKIWNGMIERRPRFIVRCASAADVAAALNFARGNGLTVAVRGGGHGIAGNAICDGGLVIDLSQMKAVKVDAAARRATVEPGATLADVDRETQAFGLVLPTGINSTTGIAGLTLGGGFGWLTRKFGLTSDNLLSADVVTAAGEQLRASNEEHADLFWALRGGGGNFGVVTSFEFQLHEAGPEVLCGLVIHPSYDAGSVLRQYSNALANVPEELTCWAILRQAPPLPFVPPHWHSKNVLILAMCYCGGIEAGKGAAASLRSIGKPVADAVSPAPFVNWQQAFDPMLAPGARNYWKSHDFIELSDPLIGVLTEGLRNLPGPECEVFIGHLGGAAGRIATDATAFPQRSSHFVMNVHARWRKPEDDRACIEWARGIFDAAKPYAVGTAYVNFMPGDELDRVEAAYGGNYKRLAQIKKRYDPGNFFRMNQNVRPAA
jgi:FAD/FMN-containing dehydrogenase